MKMLIKYFFYLLLPVSFFACTKTPSGFGPLTDIPAPIPVTVTNLFGSFPSPTVQASKAANKITITLQIPAASGRTIKEITQVAANTTYSAIQTTALGVNGLYTNTPIPGSGTSVTFNTTFDEYKLKTGIAAVPASNALLGRFFYFLITLDNNQTILTTDVRVWVVD